MSKNDIGQRERLTQNRYFFDLPEASQQHLLQKL